MFSTFQMNSILQVPAQPEDVVIKEGRGRIEYKRP